jgi:polyhydroxyalkanoate synthesis regulator phasin
MADEKNPAEDSAENSEGSPDVDDDREGFVGRIQHAWQQTIGNYATDDGETKNLFSRLADFGALSRDEAVGLLDDVKARIEENRRELDERVEESIKRATSRMTIPSPGEIEALQARVDELESQVSKLEGGEG